ncbi:MULTISPECIES: high light inducible protein [unclassified Prochlorococcus]|uniref:high light inducible protein n=1 Tax=unclassified Prochlorococcus TaxID=2627481 RepID=UPI000533A69F|nr:MULTISPECIES: high light inducible protein [unclassified Prochlorococcus]KGG14930.1 putative high light inducible protein [Prochlorococcus sp. MIT 0602]KGG15637.1 putative high light inducible protein [Prochlorococcus sp. MIT 0603]
MNSSPYVTTESGNRQNAFPVEAQPELIENYSGYIQEAEKANGRWAMIGFIALLGSYISTGQAIPGIF